MNERILNLAEQAVIAVDNPFPGNPLNDELEKMYIPDCFAEKFAELVLQDVMNLFGDERISLHYLEQPCCEDSVYLLQLKIKEHFGVK